MIRSNTIPLYHLTSYISTQKFHFEGFMTIQQSTIPRHTSQNPIAAGDFQWILTRNCEGTEQLRRFYDCPEICDVIARRVASAT